MKRAKVLLKLIPVWACLLFSQAVYGQFLIDNNLVVASQSSKNLSHKAEYAVDGNHRIKQYSKTEMENYPYLQLDLDHNFTLDGIEVHFKQVIKDYYIFYSKFPMPLGLETEWYLSQNDIEYFYISKTLPNKTFIDLNGADVRSLIIKSGSANSISVIEVGLFGDDNNPHNNEGVISISECSDGVDNDNDNLIDCEDFPCGIVFFNVAIVKEPSCAICSDGEISVQAINATEVSKDGGLSWSSYNNTTFHFTDLLPEHYRIMARSAANCIKTEAILLEERGGGDENEFCLNGSFEEGDFTNWTGGMTQWEVGILSPPKYEFDNLDFDDPAAEESRHRLIQTDENLFDSIVPFIPLSAPSGGEYLLRLGNYDNNSDVDRATYTFTVQEENADFYFYYGLVMDDPSHNPVRDNPVFKWTISTNLNVIIASKTIRSTNDTFLDEYGDTKIKYKSWSCEYVDLKEYIGLEIRIEFILADCALGGHGAYAYIDNLCGEKIDPIADLSSTNEIWCSNQEIQVDGSNSKYFNKYKWKICKITNQGNLVQCKISEWIESFEFPKIDNLQDYYSELGGGSFQCGRLIHVELAIEGLCDSEDNAFIEIEYLCDEMAFFDYYDILHCSTFNDIKIHGVDENINANYNWIPPEYLDNQTHQFPTILGSTNINALDQTYSVTVTDENGCADTDEIQILITEELFEDPEVLENLISIERIYVEGTCYADFVAYVDLNGTNLSISDYDLYFRFAGESGNYLAEFIDESNGVYTFAYEDDMINLHLDVSVKAYLKLKDFETDYYYSTGNCQLESQYFDFGAIDVDESVYPPLLKPLLFGNFQIIPHDGSDPFFEYRPLQIYIGEIINGDTTIYEGTDHNLVKAKMTVADKVGAIIFEKEITAPPGEPFDLHNDLVCDLRGTNYEFTSQVFTVTFFAYNCSHDDEECNCQVTSCITKHCFGSLHLI